MMRLRKYYDLLGLLTSGCAFRFSRGGGRHFGSQPLDFPTAFILFFGRFFYFPARHFLFLVARKHYTVVTFRAASLEDSMNGWRIQ